MALPQGYERPSGGGADRYVNLSKLDQGQHKFRILSDIMVGWVWWTDRQPTRVRLAADVPSDVREREDNREKARHFWSMVVWNYQDEAVQVMEFTQATVQEQLAALEANSDWGDLTSYDFTITKAGEGKDTTYSVAPSPHKDVPESALSAYENVTINLEALYDGADPFSSSAKESSEDDDLDIDDLLDEID